jgi:hypothetical protein
MGIATQQNAALLDAVEAVMIVGIVGINSQTLVLWARRGYVVGIGWFTGGPDRDRTDDLFHAMEARSQLRHRPTCCRDATLLLSPLGSDSSNPPRNMNTPAGK